LRLETEIRGISSIPVAGRTENHTRRTRELENAVRELVTFDEKLTSIARSGFGPAELFPTLRHNALDDAMLSMKACWLTRLSVLLKQSHGEEASNGVRNLSPLDDWQDQANKTELHQDLPAWIAEALSQLSHLCSQVGPKAPDAKRIHEDPSNADFGSLIQAEITTMQLDSMRLACGVWWGKLDAAVLAPIRERLKILKAEQKELNAAIKEDRQPVMVAEKVPEESAEDGDSALTKLKGGEKLLIAIAQTLFQFAFTTIFGCIASCLFLRTGSILSPIISHMFCNYMGLPSVSFLFTGQSSISCLHPYRHVFFLLHALGLVLFAYAVIPCTESLQYRNIYWK
jgi:hypothetical protein